MSGEVELPNLPQPPKRTRALRALAKKQGWQKQVVVKGNPNKRFGPKLPKGFQRQRVLTPRAKKRKMMKQGWMAPVVVKGRKAKGPRKIKPWHRVVRPPKVKGFRQRKARVPRAPKRRKARTRKLRHARPQFFYGKARAFKLGMAFALLKKLANTMAKDKKVDGRNHGFTNSGHGGRTGFAGMKPRGRLW